MAKYLVILETGISSSGQIAGTVEYTVECEPSELQSKIQDRKERFRSLIFDEMVADDNLSSDYYIKVLQVLPL